MDDTPTGAERYLNKRLEDPEFRRAYEEKVARFDYENQEEAKRLRSLQRALDRHPSRAKND